MDLKATSCAGLGLLSFNLSVHNLYPLFVHILRSTFKALMVFKEMSLFAERLALRLGVTSIYRGRLLRCRG